MHTLRNFAAGAMAALLAGLSPAVAQPPAGAEPHVDEAAKALLQQAADALSKVETMQFSSHRYMTGVPIQLDFSGDVMLIRTATDKTRTPMQVKGRSKSMGPQDEQFWYMIDGAGNMTAVDQMGKVVHDGQIQPNIPAFNQRSQGEQLLMDVFFSQTPLKGEMAAETIVKEPDAEVNGEMCDVIRASKALRQGGGGTGWTMWHLSKKDHLPRRWEQGAEIGNNPPIVVIVELSNLKTNTGLKREDLAIKVPEGFEVVKHAAPALTPPAPPTGLDPSVQVEPVPPPVIGIAPGLSAPGFELKGADGSSVKLEDLKGHPSVLAFLWSRNVPSGKAGPVLEEVLGAFPPKSVNVYAMACREKTPEDATKFQGEKFPKVPVLLGADDVATLYQVKGFPSFYVLDGEGRIVEFFQTSDIPNLKDKLTAAVQKAMTKN
ncbi:MAG: redoxin domain-containing protein [Phycisphaeraceae bacterium]|nr:redoxin domain-containing protein [Phycisphaeraceae bacterium]